LIFLQSQQNGIRQQPKSHPIKAKETQNSHVLVVIAKNGL